MQKGGAPLHGVPFNPKTENCKMTDLHTQAGLAATFAHANTPAHFAALWARARQAAQDAAVAQNASLGGKDTEWGGRGFDCGFAWLTLPGNIPFGRWAKKEGIASKGYPTGLSIWYSKLHSVPTQSVSVHEAAATAARDVLAHGLQTSLISTGSRLD